MIYLTHLFTSLCDSYLDVNLCAKEVFFLAYLQVQGDCRLTVPGFWQHGAGLGCKVIKLMRHLNCWRTVWRVIKSSDGAINRLVFSLFVSTKDKHWHGSFLVFSRSFFLIFPEPKKGFTPLLTKIAICYIRENPPSESGPALSVDPYHESIWSQLMNNISDTAVERRFTPRLIDFRG